MTNQHSLFRPILTRLFGLKLSVLMAVLAVGACADHDPDWQATTNGVRGHQPTTQIDQVRHLVQFGGASMGVSAPQQAALSDFMMINNVHPLDTVIIVPPLRESLGTANLRAMSVADLLAGWGYRATQPDGGPDLKRGLAPAPQGTMAVLIRRYEILEPDCPDYSSPYLGGWHNRPSSNLGCAQGINLARMIENPEDLVQGRSLDDMNGFFGALAVNRYLLGQVITDTTTSSGGSVSGSEEDSGSGDSGSGGGGSSASLD
ncbi:MAG: CpaD family pilus assembly lipoprotein [Rhodospirillaceae bacterium]